MLCELYADEGRGPPLVYVPGIDGTGDLLLGTAARLALRFRLVRLRHRAPDPPAADRYEGLARSVVTVLDELGIDRALLLAESFGGGVALTAALEHPSRVTGLALVNSFAFFDRRWRLQASRLLAPLVPRAAFDRGRRWLAPRALFGRRRDQDAVRAFRRQPGTWFDHAYRRRLDLIRGLDLRPRLPEITQPVLLVAGDQDRIVASVRQARLMAGLLPQAHLELVEGGGHLLLPLAELPWPEWLEALAARA